MYSSYPVSKRLISVYILAIQLLFVRSVSSMNLTNAYLHHNCLVREGSYKPGSKYEGNLNHLIEVISNRKFNYGNILMSYGEAPNSVTILFQCRGDSYGPNCRSCYATAIAGFRRRCPRNKAAIIWYDQCFLDVGTIETPSSAIDYKNTFSMYNPNNVNGDTQSFNRMTREFLNELMLKAIIPDGINLVNYAAGDKRLGAKRLYAMVQCAKTPVECKVCLESSIKELFKCCGGKQGARLYLGRSCNVRYELYPFLRAENTVG
ncbi:hypothetical protein EUTSA_v10022112mg [Eutrema salsugineum]|uniref:Gnk2-homologous domain-containing protein n=1 Tax=Eutrema salsugineum TaxID=72664 RepID=V4LYS2_EUTSA|nr:putative cysteine-rich repeat secretory protein 37 [Eutrema salsugineum]ESQ47672.1 hypothetical protein EUTSA_v10022112mg [Eutrema salsugineum]